MEKWFWKSSESNSSDPFHSFPVSGCPVADRQARFGEKEQIEAATASAKSARILVVFASYELLVDSLKHVETC